MRSIVCMITKMHSNIFFMIIVHECYTTTLVYASCTYVYKHFSTFSMIHQLTLRYVNPPLRSVTSNFNWLSRCTFVSVSFSQLIKDACVDSNASTLNKSNKHIWRCFLDSHLVNYPLQLIYMSLTLPMKTSISFVDF